MIRSEARASVWRPLDLGHTWRVEFASIDSGGQAVRCVDVHGCLFDWECISVAHDVARAERWLTGHYMTRWVPLIPHAGSARPRWRRRVVLAWRRLTR